MPSWKTVAFVAAVGIAGTVVPGAGAILASVAFGTLVKGTVNRIYDNNQGLIAAGLGSAADFTGVSTLYAGITNRDIISGAHLGLTVAQQRQMITEGGFQAGMTTLGAGVSLTRFVRNRLANAPCPCFPAGTPIRTLAGSKPIDQIEAGDIVLSLPEDDPSAPADGKRVEEVFVRVSPLMRMLVGGREIRVTAEHPFFVEGRGWLAAAQLAVGDSLHTLGDGRVRIVELADAGEVRTVYNFRVAEYHTYFVGDETWDYAVWTHNSQCGPTAPQGELQGLANQVRQAGNHPAAINQRTIAVGRDARGNLHVSSSNGLDSGMRSAADRLGMNVVPSKPGLHAEENLMQAVPNLRTIGTSKRHPCGPDEHNCLGQLQAHGITIDNL